MNRATLHPGPTRARDGFILLISLVALSACAVDREPNLQWVPWLGQMEFSSATESFAEAANLPGGRALQPPPVGTIPFTAAQNSAADGVAGRQLHALSANFMPLHFTVDDAGRTLAGATLKNPLDATSENLARGAVQYQVFCAPCHGLVGAGDGPVSKRGIPGFPINRADAGPGLLPDGHVFHIMTYGRKVMPSYASQIDQGDRWRILLHLRRLQNMPK